MKKLIPFLFLAHCVTAAFSQNARPSISVVGEAKMSVSPDQVVFTFEVVTADKDLSAAKRTNDTRSAKTFTVAKSLLLWVRSISKKRYM
ncbi:MAG: SIMPL domain-containing protein [Acidobacteria bacterium]|nr:SIMPL domain-containing protein [Acidobacteriota bacterium]